MGSYPSSRAAWASHPRWRVTIAKQPVPRPTALTTLSVHAETVWRWGIERGVKITQRTPDMMLATSQSKHKPLTCLFRNFVRTSTRIEEGPYNTVQHEDRKVTILICESWESAEDVEVSLVILLHFARSHCLSSLSSSTPCGIKQEKPSTVAMPML